MAASTRKAGVRTAWTTTGTAGLTRTRRTTSTTTATGSSTRTAGAPMASTTTVTSTPTRPVAARPGCSIPGVTRYSPATSGATVCTTAPRMPLARGLRPASRPWWASRSCRSWTRTRATTTTTTSTASSTRTAGGPTVATTTATTLPTRPYAVSSKCSIPGATRSSPPTTMTTGSMTARRRCSSRGQRRASRQRPAHRSCRSWTRTRATTPTMTATVDSMRTVRGGPMAGWRNAYLTPLWTSPVPSTITRASCPARGA